MPLGGANLDATVALPISPETTSTSLLQQYYHTQSRGGSLSGISEEMDIDFAELTGVGRKDGERPDLFAIPARETRRKRSADSGDILTPAGKKQRSLEPLQRLHPVMRYEISRHPDSSPRSCFAVSTWLAPSLREGLKRVSYP